LPDGSVKQTIVGNKKDKKKQTTLTADSADDVPEISRTITRDGVMIRELADGNQILCFSDGTITYTDLRRGIWKTINDKGIVRERNLRNGVVQDQVVKLESTHKVDPET
jgi:hypothetical protein